MRERENDYTKYNDAVAINEVVIELADARQKFPRFYSAHEGLSVIYEEFIELQSEVFKKKHERSIMQMRDEAMQIAAMAIRFMADLTPREFPQ